MTAARTKEVAPGIILDYDESSRMIGVDALDVSHRMEMPKAA
ncbi:MAG: DUF2283 domain-containing protein [Rhizomicrobium sp.]